MEGSAISRDSLSPECSTLVERVRTVENAARELLPCLVYSL